MYNFSDFKQKLNKIIEHTQQELSTLRTGKAKVSMLDPVKVEAYGTSMAINEVANVGAPDPNMIVVEPWDKNLLENIEKAIQKADLNLNPVVDGDIIRITVPPLTEERRKAMVKQLQQKIESAKVMMRNARTDVKNEIEAMEGKSGVSEDDIHYDLKEMDQIMDEHMQKLEELEQQKEQELLSMGP